MMHSGMVSNRHILAAKAGAPVAVQRGATQEVGNISGGSPVEASLRPDSPIVAMAFCFAHTPPTSVMLTSSQTQSSRSGRALAFLPAACALLVCAIFGWFVALQVGWGVAGYDTAAHVVEHGPKVSAPHLSLDQDVAEVAEVEVEVEEDESVDSTPWVTGLPPKAAAPATTDRRHRRAGFTLRRAHAPASLWVRGAPARAPPAA